MDPAGREAERIADLMFWMFGGAAIIWIAVVGFTWYAIRAPSGRHGDRAARLLIVGGGVIFPTVVLGVLLAFGLAALPPLLAAAPAGSLRVSVVGEMYWWRVRYELQGGGTVELANELRLAAGAPVELELESRDVIHSFWVPALGGKMDLIPGRRNRLRLEPIRPGVYRGLCAEYCGTAHAFMAFTVVVVDRVEMTRWLADLVAPARPPADERAAAGKQRFLESGCGACHAVRGTPADGTAGPDLTHVGGRVTLAAGTLAADLDGFRRWITRADELKPGAHMPAFRMLPAEDLDALAAYLVSLR